MSFLLPPPHRKVCAESFQLGSKEECLPQGAPGRGSLPPTRLPPQLPGYLEQLPSGSASPAFLSTGLPFKRPRGALLGFSWQAASRLATRRDRQGPGAPAPPPACQCDSQRKHPRSIRAQSLAGLQRASDSSGGGKERPPGSRRLAYRFRSLPSERQPFGPKPRAAATVHGRSGPLNIS